MRGVEFHICSHDASMVRSGVVTWFAYGDGAQHVDKLAASDDPGANADAFVAAHRGSCVLFVVEHDGVPIRVGLRRGLLTNHRVFYRRNGADVAVDDVFRNAIRRVPVAERTPSDEALILHYLYRRPLGSTTYVPDLVEVLPAQAVDLDLQSGAAATHLVDRLRPVADRRSPAAYLDAVDEALQAAVDDALAGADDAALLFSGGVDSSLLLSYHADRARAVTIVPDSPEFSVETGYAEHAARLAGIDLQRVPVREDDYLALMRDTMIRLGYPTIHDMMAYKPLAMAECPSRIMMGMASDSLFGLDRRATRLAFRLANPAGRALATAGERLVPGSARKRAGRVASAVRALTAEPFGVDGWAAVGFPAGDISAVARIAGTEAVAMVLQGFVDRVAERVELQSTDRPAANFEAMHLALLVTGVGGHEDVLAQEHGRRVVAPFEDHRVVDAALSIPADERYMSGGVVKWIPKRLVERRLPGYPALQEKKYTALPIARYYESGPLAGLWDRYELPEFLDDEARRSVLSGYGPMAWNAMSHAMWIEHVARNDSLPPYPETVSLSTGSSSGDLA